MKGWITAFGPIISWQIDGEIMETVTDFIFLGSKITADGDCSHKIKRHLLLERKAMTNLVQFSSVHFSSVAQSCPTLCDPMNHKHAKPPCPSPTPRVHPNSWHWVSDDIQPSHPLSSPSPAFNLSQDWGLFQWVSSSHQVAKVLEPQLQHQSFRWIFRIDFL